jgi:hypothetical protein
MIRRHILDMINRRVLLFHNKPFQVREKMIMNTIIILTYSGYLLKSKLQATVVSQIRDKPASVQKANPQIF